LGKKGAQKKELGLSDLLQVACDLTELYELITLMRDDENVREAFDVQVKGRGEDLVLLPTLKKCHDIIDDIDVEGKIFVSLHDEFDDCVNYLDENYSIKSKWLKDPENLRDEDLEKIADYLDNIIRSLVGYADNLAFIPNLKEDKSISRLVKSLDKSTKDDLQEAMKAYGSGLTTAAFMLFCRVAEKMAGTYYENFTKNKSKDKSWDFMRGEINSKQHQENNVKWSILNLFGFFHSSRGVYNSIFH